MKKICKILLLLYIMLFSLILIPSFSKATTYTVNTSEELLNKIQEAQTGDTISLGTNIALTAPIGISDKNLIINGNGFTISRDTENWSNDGQNGTLITAGNGSTLTLNNLNLRGAAKYGVQAYNGGNVILNKVTIGNCEYGGILVNGGTIEIIDLTLYKNREGENVGIEIGKGTEVTNTPKVIMNGTISSTETKNVLYLAENDQLDEFEVDNKEGTVDKILLDDNKVVITNEYNEVLFESNENDDVSINGTEYVENVIVTINLGDKAVEVGVEPGTTLSKERATSAIDLEDLGLSNYVLNGFYSDEALTKVFDFKTPITKATVIYAKLDLKEPEAPSTPVAPKDETPKTGDNTIALEISFALLVFSTLCALILKRKEF